MSVDLSSLGSMASLGPLDLQSPTMTGGDETAKIKQVSKAMEYIFANQLTAELGKSMEGADGATDSSQANYSDFIHQAMTQGMTSGSGLGLAKNIEEFLTRHSNARPPVTPDAATTTIHHADLHPRALHLK